MIEKRWRNIEETQKRWNEDDENALIFNCFEPFWFLIVLIQVVFTASLVPIGRGLLPSHVHTQNLKIKKEKNEQHVFADQYMTANYCQLLPTQFAWRSDSVRCSASQPESASDVAQSNSRCPPSQHLMFTMLIGCGHILDSCPVQLLGDVWLQVEPR
jgi:hypothetical protein